MSPELRILVVDDEDSIRKRCVQVLARHGYDVVAAADARSALKLLGSRGFDLVLADIRMPVTDGLELLAEAKRTAPDVEVIMMTGYAAVETAVKAMKAGALDYLTKPFDVDELVLAVGRVAEKRALQREVVDLRRQLHDRRAPRAPVGESPAIRRVLGFVRKVAAADCNVLICGESGTGKEVVARAIHDHSPRRERPFVIADCAALSGSILGSELFGHVKGAFTGAQAEHRGYFESAEGGTLFLDEVGELPLDVQGKLLRAVQEQVVVRVGATRPTRVDVRILAATNRDLPALVARKEFREDLFYRLNVVNVTVPPLRERREDVPLLVAYFLKRFAAQLRLPKVPKISADELERAAAYGWPGNVRELENAVQRALVLAEGDRLTAEDLLPHPTAGSTSARPSATTGPALRAVQRKASAEAASQHLADTLRRFGGNVTRAAEALGMRRTSLQRLLKNVGLDAASFRPEAPPK